MALSLTQNTYYDLIQSGTSVLVSEHEEKWLYPDSLGQGYLYQIDLRDGLEMAISRYQLRHHLSASTPERPHPIECTFYLEGCEENYVDTSPDPNCYGFFGNGLAAGSSSTVPAERPNAWLSFHIDPERFEQWLGDRPLPLPELLRSPEQLYYSQFGPITASMQMVLHQIRHCPYTGVIKPFYLESKAWELITLCLHDILSQGQPATPASSLKPADIERIHHARDLLVQRFDPTHPGRTSPPESNQ